jgi:hydroxyethylthiazole kinase-like uncharacterized protein yjeF
MNDTDSKQALPRALYRAASVREMDRLAIEEHGIAGFELMRRAAQAALDLLLASWPGVTRIAVLCGAGNNGGDGYLVAALGARQGIEVDLYGLAPQERLQGDALLAYQMAVDEGLCVQGRPEGFADDVQVLVDGLLGTGLCGAVRQAYADAIDVINRAGKPVLALDVPSGLCSDTGRVLGVAVRAQRTLSFIGIKQGLLTGQGRDCCGELHFDDLSVPDAVPDAVPADCIRLDRSDIGRHLAPRAPTDHKGRYGHVLVVGGELGMGGAGILAARAAGRAGGGLVTLATRTQHVAGALAQAPEVMTRGIESGQDLQHLLPAATVVVIGPGLGREPWAEQLLQRCLQSGKPLVVDADALNLIAQGRFTRCAQYDNWVITPHPGEAARLLNWSVAQVQGDRFAAVKELQSRFGATVLLKGSGSLLADKQGAVALCPYGNPGMASGGMGDVLSGIIGALQAQGLESGLALRLAVTVHACAADHAAGDGERGMLASDLLPLIRRLLNPVVADDVTLGDSW